ncbi:hypothetical protein DFH27DRAFT_582899 [Peziza echinospora]|nr:hypothetical protein DFH27DRAFT_582899 [Peziza echinospora]
MAATSAQSAQGKADQLQSSSSRFRDRKKPPAKQYRSKKSLRGLQHRHQQQQQQQHNHHNQIQLNTYLHHHPTSLSTNTTNTTTEDEAERPPELNHRRITQENDDTRPESEFQRRLGSRGSHDVGGGVGASTAAPAPSSSRKRTRKDISSASSSSAANQQGAIEDHSQQPPLKTRKGARKSTAAEAGGVAAPAPPVAPAVGARRDATTTTTTTTTAATAAATQTTGQQVAENKAQSTRSLRSQDPKKIIDIALFFPEEAPVYIGKDEPILIVDEEYPPRQDTRSSKRAGSTTSQPPDGGGGGCGEGNLNCESSGGIPAPLPPPLSSPSNATTTTTNTTTPTTARRFSPIPQPPPTPSTVIPAARSAPITTFDFSQFEKKAARIKDDPLPSTTYIQTHKKHAAKEKRWRNVENERSQQLYSRLKDTLEKLKGPDWVRILKVQRADDAEGLRKRSYLIRSIEKELAKQKRFTEEIRRQKRAKMERTMSPEGGARSVCSDPGGGGSGGKGSGGGGKGGRKGEGTAGASSAAMEYHHDESAGRDYPGSSGGRSSKQAKFSRKSLPLATAPPPPSSSSSHHNHNSQQQHPPLPPPPPPQPPKEEKPFLSFFTKPHLRHAATKNWRKSARNAMAFGEPIPVVPTAEFELPKGFVDEVRKK